MTEDDFFRWGFDEKSWSLKTRKEYSWKVEAANRWFTARGKNLDSATLAELREYLFSTKPSAVNRNRIRSALIGYGSFLTTAGVRQDNPARDLPRLRERRGLPNPLQTDEPGELMKQAADYSPMFDALVCLYLHTGLRLSELANLRWDELRGDWAVLVQKRGELRTVFVNGEALKALAKWRMIVEPSEWVFPSPVLPGRPISGSWVWRKIRELGDEAGINGCRPHRLRHSYGSALYRDTRDIALVQRAMGHASIASTVGYAQVEPVDVAEAVSHLTYQ